MYCLASLPPQGLVTASKELRITRFRRSAAGLDLMEDLPPRNRLCSGPALFVHRSLPGRKHL